MLADPLPRRWQHVQAVGAKAERLGRRLGAEDIQILAAAGWLHDIGYSPSIKETRFHALDGARWLVSQGFCPRLAGLVAHHSCASYEADERGLSEAIWAEFPREESVVSDVLWFADMTTCPDGQDLTVGERLAEIRERYGPEDLVTKFWTEPRHL
ncbi:HD domain-containing protein [Micromonospora tulbaghiae]|uniref:HD domain-containing protein n=1 Tax=Micromonospora tulbaghiae TaxID=479978 RepID=UPI0033CE77CB